MKRDGSIKLQLKVEYFTLANFTSNHGTTFLDPSSLSMGSLYGKKCISEAEGVPELRKLTPRCYPPASLIQRNFLVMFSLAAGILLNNLFYMLKVLQDTQPNNNKIKFSYIMLIQKIQLDELNGRKQVYNFHLGKYPIAHSTLLFF